MLRLASVFTDHMVLQREKPIRIFGEADGPVRLALGGHELVVQSADGRFLAQLPPMPAGGPYCLTVSCGEACVRLQDVLVGEVWLCGGQSNMEFRLRDAQNGLRDAETANQPEIRFYETPVAAKVDDALLAMERERSWKRLESGACGDVSAVAFYCAQALYERLRVPIGMVICCLGGSSASCWMERGALTAFAEGEAYWTDFERRIAGKTDEQFDAELAAYEQKLAVYNAGLEKLKKEKPGIEWPQIEAELGAYPWPPPDGRWMLRRPCGCYDTMLSRLLPLSLRGFFFYQGEEDTYLKWADGYATLLERLIAHWRERFADDGLWFIAAQLPRFGADGAQDWAKVRAAQQKATERAGKAALACLIDCGETHNVHPIDKKTPAERLARLALLHVYGYALDAEAPRLCGAERLGGRIVLRFANAGGGLRLERTDAIAVDGAEVTKLEARGDEIWLECEGLRGAAHVRYAQENDPAAALFGASDLPAFPFEAEIGREQ